MHASMISSHGPDHQTLGSRHTPSHHVLQEREITIDPGEILVRGAWHGGQLFIQEPSKRLACLWVRGSLATRKGKCPDGSLH